MAFLPEWLRGRKGDEQTQGYADHTDPLRGSKLQGQQPIDSFEEQIRRSEEMRMQQRQETLRVRQVQAHRDFQRMMSQTQGPSKKEEPKEKAYPLEGEAITILNKLGPIMDSELTKSILCDMVMSSDTKERTYAAVHKDTPMSSITIHLLTDKDKTVRYIAEKRVEAWEGEDGTD